MSRGGRGGRGRGKPSVFTPQLMGHLAYNDIIENSKIGNVLYPTVDMVDTDEPDEVEARVARRRNNSDANQKFTPYWLDSPTKASSHIEKYSDRFKTTSAVALDGSPMAALEDTHIQRAYDRTLLPNAIFEGTFEKKKKTSTRAKASTRTAKKATDALGDEDDDGKASVAGSDENEDEEEEPELDEEAEEEEEDENDYGDNYFDGGEDDGGEGGDALGGGGDEDGGTFD